MSQTTHTPGPWMVLPYGGVGPSVKACICKPDGSSQHEATANACLISAAPELLLELQFMVEQFDVLTDRCKDYSRLADGARAAIAKAKGEQS